MISSAGKPSPDEKIPILRQVEVSTRVPAKKRAKLGPEPSPAPSLMPQSRLHNFSFPTSSWGAKRLFRCMKTPGEIAPVPAKKPSSSSEEGAAAAGAAVAVAERPWNLRSKRSGCVAPLPLLPPPPHPVENGRSGWTAADPPSTSASCLPAEAALPGEEKSGARRSRGSEKRPRFSISLTRKEIEADFLAMTGKKPPRRHKKRPKEVQKRLDALFPGFDLIEITPDMYKIDE